MTTTYLGSMSIGGALPGAQAMAVAASAGINAALPDIQGRIAALQAFAPSPVDFNSQLALAQQVLSSVQQSITLGLPVPSISAQIASVTALLGTLLSTVSSIQAQLGVVESFQGLLAAAGIHALAYQGALSALGSEVGATLATVPGLTAGDPTQAVLLLSTSPAAWAALSQIVKVSA